MITLCLHIWRIDPILTYPPTVFRVARVSAEMRLVICGNKCSVSRSKCQEQITMRIAAVISQSIKTANHLRATRASSGVRGDYALQQRQWLLPTADVWRIWVSSAGDNSNVGSQHLTNGIKDSSLIPGMIASCLLLLWQLWVIGSLLPVGHTILPVGPLYFL